MRKLYQLSSCGDLAPTERTWTGAEKLIASVAPLAAYLRLQDSWLGAGAFVQGAIFERGRGSVLAVLVCAGWVSLPARKHVTFQAAALIAVHCTYSAPITCPKPEDQPQAPNPETY